MILASCFKLGFKVNVMLLRLSTKLFLSPSAFEFQFATGLYLQGPSKSPGTGHYDPGKFEVSQFL